MAAIRLLCFTYSVTLYSHFSVILIHTISFILNVEYEIVASNKSKKNIDYESL